MAHKGAAYHYKLVDSESELKDAFRIRRRVFIIEQNIPPNLEYDQDDRTALHMLAQEGGKAIGTARALFLSHNQAKLERLAVLKPFRGRGIGSEIIFFLEKELKNQGVEKVILHAQCRATAFYKSCGYQETGTPFWEVGIKHIKMQKQL
ncbi:MAG: GNAT family N-acetyltransferase [Dehalococcoidia bacterium]|nr:MAG: GNAT family N-acetyltransferase [Dehalococcoidia bacterium]